MFWPEKERRVREKAVLLKSRLRSLTRVAMMQWRSDRRIWGKIEDGMDSGFRAASRAPV